MRKKMLSIIAALAVALCMMPAMAFASSAAASVSDLVSRSGTNVTVTDASSGSTYTIASQTEMTDFIDYVNNGGNTENVTFTVTPLADGAAYSVTSVIAPVAASNVTSASTNSPAIADSVAGFEGTFDGGGSTFNLSISTSLSATGMFGYVKSSGTVKNFTITGTVTVTGSKDAVGGVAGFSKGTVDRITNKAEISAVSAYNVGGIVGFNEGFVLNSAGRLENPNDADTAASTVGAVTGYSKVGGIVGENAGIINSCGNAGAVKGRNYSKNGVGGIAGRNGNNNAAVETGRIYNCWNSGDIRCRADGATSGGGKWVGGICGFENSLSTCVNCYNIGSLTAYNTVDNIAGKIEGTVVNCYGLIDSDGTSSYTKAEGYDGAVKRTAATMKTKSFLNEISVGATERWAQPLNSEGGAAGYPYPLRNAAKTDSNPSTVTYTLSMTSAPVKTVYQAGETFDVSGMVVTVSNSDGTKGYLTDFTVGNTSSLTTADESVSVSCVYGGQTYTYSVSIDVVSPSAFYLNPSTGDDTRDGTSEANAVKTAAKAIELATADSAKGNTVYLMGTADLTATPGDASTQGNVVFKRGSGFTGTMFNVNAGSGTVLMNNFTVNESGTIFAVSSGTLHLRGSAYVKSSSGTAIDVASSGNLKIERALVSGSTNCISIAGSSNTFTLSDFGGTTLSGKVYLGTGAYITVGARIPCSIAVELETASDGLTFARSTSSYSLTEEDASKVNVAGYTVGCENNRLYIYVEEE